MSLLRQLAKLFGHHQASEEPATQAGRVGFPPPSRAQGAGFPPPSRAQSAGFPPPGAALLAEFPPPNAVPNAATPPPQRPTAARRQAPSDPTTDTSFVPAQRTAAPAAGFPPVATAEPVMVPAKPITIPVELVIEPAHPVTAPASQQFGTATPDASGWYMPTYRERDISDWVPEVRRLKRSGELEAALTLATGCTDAMVQAAERNPANVMEHYVIEVVRIQHKMARYSDEVNTIESWLGREIPASRDDHRLDLRKRLAKARELVARSEGRDSSAHHAEWKRLVALQKASKQQGAPASTPPARQSPRAQVIPERAAASHQPAPSRARASSSRRRPSKFIPALDEFLAQPFVAADFETANRSSGVSACQIALVRVESGRVVDRFNTLLKPPSGFDDFEFTYLHGISAHDTRTAPSWPDIVPAIRGFAGDATVYAHNAPFDSRVWRQLDEFFHTRSLPDHFFCSYLTARRMMPGLDNYRLPTVLERCAPQFVLDHHKADSDAEACALIVAALQSNPELYARLEAHR